ncbi:hypothetical protein [Apilactobacillus timberlakei]|nr:hypothetical protein [Apilactobacillus timberlakei]
MAIITAVTTILSIVIAYITEHHDSNSKQIAVIQATVKQQLELKDSQYQELQNKYEDKFKSLKQTYEEKINSLKEEVNTLKCENKSLRQRLNKRENKE